MAIETAPLPDMQPYYAQVWQFVRQVPRGRIVTYGQIAKTLPCPDDADPEQYKAYGSRWVGTGMSVCPSDVPWQRVINSQGKISQRQDADIQRKLLENEGILFAKDKINLKEYQWHGPNSEEVPRQGRLF